MGEFWDIYDANFNNQIKDVPNSYLVIDTDSTENSKKIPLWLFGFLY